MSDDSAKLYRASLIGFVLAVSVDGDEGELEEKRATILRISRIGESDAAGRVQLLDFYGHSLIDCALAAQDAGLSFESLALSEPCGNVTRVYVQSLALTQAAAESADAISFHAVLSGDVLCVRPPYDDEDDGDYLRIMEMSFHGQSHSVLLGGSDLYGCIDAAKRNFTIHTVKFISQEKRRPKQETPWRADSF